MSDSSVVKGVDTLVAKFKRLRGASDEIMGQSLLAGAFVLEGVIKGSMQQTSKGGRTYRRGKKSHTASTPGSPPAIDYGALFNSIQSEREEKGAIVYTDKEYAPALETGTARMAARPFMRPAADEHEQEVAAAVQATARRLIQAAAE
jgi:HK97 gp10 family phage protein